MTELLDEFVGLLKDMEKALAVNDVQRVNELTARQQNCLVQLVDKSKTNPELKTELRKYMPEIQRQMSFNEKLLNQALQITDSLMNAIYKSIHKNGLVQGQASSRSYSA